LAALLLAILSAGPPWLIVPVLEPALVTAPPGQETPPALAALASASPMPASDDTLVLVPFGREKHPTPHGPAGTEAASSITPGTGRLTLALGPTESGGSPTYDTNPFEVVALDEEATPDTAASSSGDDVRLREGLSWDTLALAV